MIKDVHYLTELAPRTGISSELIRTKLNISENGENNLAGIRPVYKEFDFPKTCAHS